MQKKRNRYIVLLLCLSFVSLIILSISFVKSKYTGTISNNNAQISSEFYFESDQLTSEGNSASPYNLYNWDASKDYTFNISLRNWADQLNISDIDYSATLYSDNENIIFSSNPVYFNTKENPKPGYFTETYVTVTVPANSPITNNKFTINAVTKDHYYKELSATYQLIAASDPSGSNVAQRYDNIYVDLSVPNILGNSYTITWPASLSPDNTNPLLANADDSTRNITISGTGKYENFRFFITGTLSPTDVFTVNGEEVKIP